LTIVFGIGTWEIEGINSEVRTPDRAEAVDQQHGAGDVSTAKIDEHKSPANPPEIIRQSHLPLPVSKSNDNRDSNLKTPKLNKPKVVPSQIDLLADISDDNLLRKAKELCLILSKKYRDFDMDDIHLEAKQSFGNPGQRKAILKQRNQIRRDFATKNADLWAKGDTTEKRDR
jgi:hypothetical protein